MAMLETAALQPLRQQPLGQELERERSYLLSISTSRRPRRGASADAGPSAAGPAAAAPAPPGPEPKQEPDSAAPGSASDED
eukprot:12918162-Alexandrium_andersonii.AAC.1